MKTTVIETASKQRIRKKLLTAHSNFHLNWYSSSLFVGLLDLLLGSFVSRFATIHGMSLLA